MKCAWFAWIGLSALIVAGGCASTGGKTESPSLDGSAWVLKSLPGRASVAGAMPTARFEAGQVSGSDGCNRYSMPVKVSGSTIAIGPTGPSTQMACPEDIMAQAQAFMTGLQNARSFKRNAQTLELMDASGAIVATLAAQDRALAGTSWKVMNINNGREAVVSIVTGSTVTMAFDRDGRVSGSTGCNQYNAGYTVEGDSLRFSLAAATLRACADPAIDEQEQAFLRAIQTVATMQMEGDQLWLRTKDDAIALILVRAAN